MDTIAETLERQSEIIQMQAELIKRLSSMLLQFAEMTEAELNMITRSVDKDGMIG